MKNFLINEELANAIYNYLAVRPYREVAGLIAGLGQLEPIEPKQEDDPLVKDGADQS